MSNHFLNLLSRLTTVKIDKFADSDQLAATDDDRTPASILEGANCVSSRYVDDVWSLGTPHHAVLLDLDVPAYLVPSSTPGHSHLYIDVTLTESDYYELLDALAKARILEPGYVTASKRKGGTHLRLPWVRKGDQTPSPSIPVTIPATTEQDPF